MAKHIKLSQYIVRFNFSFTHILQMFTYVNPQLSSVIS